MIVISENVIKKLQEKHGVSEIEVRQALHNRTRSALYDTRENHKTDPPTQWLISFTNQRRRLKVCFILTDGDVNIKTAYEPNSTEIAIYLNASREL